MSAKESKMGRPRKEIDWDQVDKLCHIQCTQVEICGFLEVCEDTLNSRCKEEHGVTFSEYLKQKSQPGKISLRRRQYKTAMDGNCSMQIWLGKQWLGQSEDPAGDSNKLSEHVTIMYKQKDENKE